MSRIYKQRVTENPCPISEHLGHSLSSHRFSSVSWLWSGTSGVVGERRAGGVQVCLKPNRRGLMRGIANQALYDYNLHK